MVDINEIKLPVADLFCGAGGLSLGLKRAGFTPVFATDLDPYACATYEANLGEHVRKCSAAQLSASLICDETGLVPGQLALVCGGPPCQGFSIQRRGKRADERNSLVIDFATIAVGLRPAFILIENVPTLFGARGRTELSQALEVMREAHYEHAARVLDAADYGIPQHRRRAFVVAWRSEDVHGFLFPKPTHDEFSYETVADALRGLPEPLDEFTMHPDFHNHIRVKISAINEERISHVPRGGGRTDLPEHLQLRCHKKANGHRHLDVFGRMEWGKPAPTITAMFDNFTRGRFAHPDQNRCITAREGARLQGFPDTFAFRGPKKDVARQIGNAVPPLLAQRIGEAIAASLLGQYRTPRQLSLPMASEARPLK
jgi:DNA (cytosine-5)-methyltransferase 1